MPGRVAGGVQGITDQLPRGRQGGRVGRPEDLNNDPRPDRAKPAGPQGLGKGRVRNDRVNLLPPEMDRAANLGQDKDRVRGEGIE